MLFKTLSSVICSLDIKIHSKNQISQNINRNNSKTELKHYETCMNKVEV